MSKRKYALLVGCALLVLVVPTGLYLKWRSLQESWGGIQMRNAAELGLSINEYYEFKGEYPEQLNQLVSGGVMSKKEFDKLMFRPEPYSEAKAWIYKKPDKLTDVVVVAPGWVITKKNPNLYTRPMGSADGGAQAVTRSKSHHLPEWAQNQKR